MNKRVEIKFAVSKLVEEINVMKKKLSNQGAEKNAYIYIHTHTHK